jgi:hypothetical protein
VTLKLDQRPRASGFRPQIDSYGNDDEFGEEMKESIKRTCANLKAKFGG